MSFKEDIESDINGVFLNLEEFAEKHRIEGQEITCILDNNKGQSKTNRPAG